MDTAAAATTSDPARPASRNRAARASIALMTLGVAALLSFVTVIGWVNPPFFVATAVICALGAIVTGHVGRRTGRRSGVGRGEALLGIVVGWLLLVVAGVAVLLSVGVLAGLAAVAG